MKPAERARRRRPEPPFGAHVSVAGGVDRAFPRGEALGCRAIQVFVKSPNRWAGPPLEASTVEAFRAAREASPIGPVVAHAAYLVNLAATDARVLERSLAGLADELDRCDRLGIDALVVHPGAHLGAGTVAGTARVARSLEPILAERPTAGARLLLELTAGQGTVLGRRLEELARIRDGLGPGLAGGGALGLCIDTCHAFAAGYGIDRRRGYDRFWRRLDRHFDARDLAALHLNDSRYPCGSRRDRHANLGEGAIGTALFKRLLADPRTRGVPMILETPLGEERAGHRRDLARLRSWAGTPSTG